MAPSRRAARLYVCRIRRDELARPPVGLQGCRRPRKASRRDGGRPGLASLCEEAVGVWAADGPANLFDGAGEVFAAVEEVAVRQSPIHVMAGLDPATHPLRKSWIARASPPPPAGSRSKAWFWGTHSAA